MKKQLKLLLFVVALLTLVMMTMIVVSAETTGEETPVFTPGDGDTQEKVEAAGGVFDEANYNFKVVDKDGNTVGYYINLGSSVATEAGGAWAAVPDGGKLLLLKDLPYSVKTTYFMINANSFTFDGQGFTVSGVPNWKIQNGVDYEVEAGAGIVAESGTTVASNNTIKIYNLTVKGSSAIYELRGAGTKYQFEKTVTTSSSYGYHINAENVTLELLGDENVNTIKNSRMFNILKTATVIVHGGTYTANSVSSKDNAFFYVASAAKANIVVNGGTFDLTSIDTTNARICMFLLLGATNVTVNDGTFHADLMSKTSNMIHIATGAKVADGFDVIFTVNDGSFIREGLATDGDYGNAIFHVYGANSVAQININGGYFQAPACIFELQNNTATEINISGGELYVPNKTTREVTVDGQAAERSYTGQAIIWYYNGATITRAIGGKDVTNSINVTGGTFTMANKSMPIVYARNKVAQGTTTAPIAISFKNVTFEESARLLVLSAKAASYYDVTIDNVTFTQSGSREFITAEGTATNVTVSVINSTITAKTLFFTKSTATISAEVDGGSYTITSALFPVSSTAASDLYIVDGSFVVPTVDALYDSLVDTFTEAGEFVVQKITVDTVFDDVADTIFSGEATMKTTYFHVLDDGAEHTFASVDDMLALIDATFMSTLPDYVTIEGVSLEIDGGTNVIFTGGEYTSYTTYFFHVVNGTVVATDATFNAPYGRFVYVTAADASVDLSFTNCNITSGESYHMFQGSLTDGAVMAKFHLTFTGGTYNAGKNIISFGPATDAEVIFNSGNFTAGGYIMYTGSVGKYAFLGGTYTTDSYLMGIVANNAVENTEYTINVSGVTVNAYHFFSCEISGATLNLNVKNVTAFLASTAFASSDTASGTFNLTVENSMFVITREEGAATTFLAGLADLVTLTLNGNVTIVTNADTTLVGDKVIDANAPAIKYAGVLYRAYFSSKTEYDATFEAQLYLGSEADKLGGIRFTTALSDDVVALVKTAVDAQLPVSYGMLIAPADYVIAAGAFTKEALDARFGSTAGVLASGKNTYVDVPAVNSKRDANEDGVFESFSAMLINVQEANYNRAFAAIAYVVVDGEIYYSTFNTLDQARSAKYMAEELIATELYADDETIMALLNKYAGVAAE